MSDLQSTHTVEILYRDHHRWLWGWLRKKLGNEHEAADLAQDTFVRVIRSRRLADNVKGEPRAFLTHVAKGLVIDHWRRKAVETAYLEAILHLPPVHVPSEETRLLILEALTRIDQMLSSLPERTREVFLLAQLDGKTLKQIAEQMQMPLITVRRSIHKALVACMQAL